MILASVLATLMFANFSVYAFALMDFPGGHLLFGLTPALLLAPEFLTLIPLSVRIRALTLPSNDLAIILPTIVAGHPFAILVMRAAFGEIPRDLLEATRLDGAGHLALPRRLVLLATLPVLVSVAIIRLIPVWNEYLAALAGARRAAPHPARRAGGLSGRRGGPTAVTPNYGALMPSYVLAAVSLVLLFAFLMRFYIRGVKG